jgi:hypothetical protein
MNGHVSLDVDRVLGRQSPGALAFANKGVGEGSPFVDDRDTSNILAVCDLVFELCFATFSSFPIGVRRAASVC